VGHFGVNAMGSAAIITTNGNPDTHVIPARRGTRHLWSGAHGPGECGPPASRLNLPYRRHWDGPQTIPEREGLRPRVDEQSHGEALGETIPQARQMADV